MTTTEEAIFLNFLWVYMPADSSHLCSTGSATMTGLGSLVVSSSVAFSMGLVEVGLLLVVDELEDLDLEVAELVSCRAVVLDLPVNR